VVDLPVGAYERLVTVGLDKSLQPLDRDLVQGVPLDAADAHEVLSRHIAALTRQALRAVPGQDVERLVRQVEVANRIAAAITALLPRAVDADDLIAASHDLLTAIVERPPPPAQVRFPARPEIPLATGALLVNGRGEPRIGTEVAREMASADEVDLLCAFIKWHGLRLIEDAIRNLVDRGAALRVITTGSGGLRDDRADRTQRKQRQDQSGRRSDLVPVRRMASLGVRQSRNAVGAAHGGFRRITARSSSRAPASSPRPRRLATASRTGCGCLIEGLAASRVDTGATRLANAGGVGQPGWKEFECCPFQFVEGAFGNLAGVVRRPRPIDHDGRGVDGKWDQREGNRRRGRLSQADLAADGQVSP
jgi:hypothetical protein